MNREEYDSFFINKKTKIKNSIFVKYSYFTEDEIYDIMLDIYIYVLKYIETIDKNNVYNYFMTSCLSKIKLLHKRKNNNIINREKYYYYLKTINNEEDEEKEINQILLNNIYNILDNLYIIDFISSSVFKQKFFCGKKSRVKNESQLLKTYQEISKDLNIEKKVVIKKYNKTKNIIKNIMNMTDLELKELKDLLNRLSYTDNIPSSLLQEMIDISNKIFNTKNVICMNCSSKWAQIHLQLKNVYLEVVKTREGEKKNMITITTQEKNQQKDVVVENDLLLDKKEFIEVNKSKKTKQKNGQ